MPGSEGGGPEPGRGVQRDHRRGQEGGLRPSPAAGRQDRRAEPQKSPVTHPYISSVQGGPVPFQPGDPGARLGDVYQGDRGPDCTYSFDNLPIKS